MNLSQTLCKWGWCCVEGKEKGLHSTEKFAANFTELNLAVEQEHRQQAGCNDKAFLNA